MTSLKEVFSETNGLYCKIDRSLKLCTYVEFDDLSGLEISYKDSEQLFLLEELQSIMESLNEVRGRLAYLALPVKEVSGLHKNSSGRYETDSGHYYTCGSPIEALVQDGRWEVPHWVSTRLECNDKGYYLVGYGNVDMDSLTVRVRGEV